MKFSIQLDEERRFAERCPRAAGSSCVGERKPYPGPRCSRCDRLNP